MIDENIDEMEYEVDQAFKKLDQGIVPTRDEISTLKYVCGYCHPSVNETLNNIFNDFNNIFKGSK